MAFNKDFEDLSVADLKEKLQKIWRRHEKLFRESMGVYLYWLRKKMRAQGARNDKKAKPEGFGAWCEENLHITRRTADNWADDWAIAEGLKKPSKKTAKTFRKDSKSDQGNPVDGSMVVDYQMTLTQEENRAWLDALRVLGVAAAQKVIFNAVLEAAHVLPPKKPAVSVTDAQRKRMTFLDETPDTILAGMEAANAKGAGK
jgi:hypothetical protein